MLTHLQLGTCLSPNSLALVFIFHQREDDSINV